ncbi:hypothetical protein CYG48_00580 [Neorhizobium sp. SOG26]|jgi:hypothetical protein|uniref:hypothetical protein n=1 Tax=Neorhizobium sp. SOG26 TaxID=2060726 RepID=UPI000E5973E5|nr:hypothetical protein [Neorhizobium sp. SOG26]AXV14342.1 hypothetical protein CYG48_00580 [Neorhizobium sp. SOG26]
MTPEERIQRHEETIERLRADIEWLHQTGFWTEAATNEELIREIEGVASLYLSIIKELSRPPG